MPTIINEIQKYGISLKYIADITDTDNKIVYKWRKETEVIPPQYYETLVRLLQGLRDINIHIDKDSWHPCILDWNINGQTMTLCIKDNRDYTNILPSLVERINDEAIRIKPCKDLLSTKAPLLESFNPHFYPRLNPFSPK